MPQLSQVWARGQRAMKSERFEDIEAWKLARGFTRLPLRGTSGQVNYLKKYEERKVTNREL